MADTTSKVWVDSTFVEPIQGSKDVYVEYHPAADENIGSHSIPVIYKTAEALPADYDVRLTYFQELITESGVFNVPLQYFTFTEPKMEGVYISLVEFLAGEKDKTDEKDLDLIYTTGFNSISGSLDKKLTFIAGKQQLAFDDTPVNFRLYTSSSGYLSFLHNYTNFSGNISTSGTPIAFYDTDFSIIAEYGGYTGTTTSGYLNRIVEITFAGWVDHNLTADVYSSLLGYKHHYDFEVTVSGGGVDANYLEAYSSVLSLSGIECETYCSLVDMAEIGAEAATISGSISYYKYEVYSTIEDGKPLTLDIDLFSIKITNFSLDVGEYTEAEGLISVDVLDDTCPISTSETYFMVDGVRVPVTFSGIQDGYRMFYDPIDDFSSLDGPTTFTVHVENECDKTLEQDFYLTFGYIVEYINNPGQSNNMDYGFNNKIAVRVTAENYASCPQISALAWEFESKEQLNNDLGASIIGKFHALDDADISAEIKPDSTAYFYGKEFEVIVNAKDFAGNKMEPLVLKYRIENKPEN